MKIGLMPNFTRNGSLNVTSDICDVLNANGAECLMSLAQNTIFDKTGVIYLPEDEMLSEADVVIAVGGDGTLIHAAKKAALSSKPILGINCGRLAFMSGLESNELQLLPKLINGDYHIDKRLMLKTEYSNDKGDIRTDYCVNDCYVTNEEKARLSTIDVSLNGAKFNSYLCDGLILATPTGSTAYSLSAGGPVVDPELESIILTPTCPHSLVDRSLIFKPDAEIKIESGENANICFSNDGMKPVTLPSGSSLNVSAADISADFIRIKSDNFIDILYTKLATRR